MPAVLFAEEDVTDPFGDWLDEETEGKKAGLVASSEVDLGIQIVEQQGNSSKFNEYKDDDSDIYLNRLFLDVFDAETGNFFDFRGRRLSRDDQQAYLEFGSYNVGESSAFQGWRIDLAWTEIPHLLSNSAKTPYIFLGNGAFQVPGGIVDAIQISNIGDASSWTAANAGPGLPGEDLRIASVLAESVHPTDLGTHRQTGTFGFNLFFSPRTQGRLELEIDSKDGSIVTGAGIGDRPPRTLDVQLPEPIDYKTYDLKLSLAHNGDNYQIDTSYLYSKFENDVQTLTWNSLFHAPDFFCADIVACAGATDFDRIRQGSGTSYATTGAIALTPDNTYHNFTVNGGINLPWRSNLRTSISYGLMQQDEDLLPYATSDFGGTQTPDALPRTSADAEIETLMFNAVYSINPLPRVNLQLHYRYYDLDNQTDQAVWQGNTQDSNSRSFKSERFNVGYDLQQDNLGASLSYHLGKPGTFKLSYEREEQERPQREVRETDEDTYKVSYRVRPTSWSNLSAKYVHSERDGSAYNGEITDQSYAYDPATQLSAADNPLLAFSNAPGLRKFDVSDREKDEVDISVSFFPMDGVNVNLNYRQREQDYQSDIPSTINTWDAATLSFVDAFADPTQLGLLKDESERSAIEINYAPSDRLNLVGFYSWERFKIDQRGRFLDENNRVNATGTSSIATGTKDWQDTSGDFLWDAEIDDTTHTVGLDLNFTIIEEKLLLAAGFARSKGDVVIDYNAGANVAEDDATSFKNWSEWSSPPDVRFKTRTLSLDVDYLLSAHWTLGFKYLFEIYKVQDWQQEATGAHQNALNQYFVADQDPETAGTSQDRAGSRLVRLGDVLAPDYDAHVGLLTVRYSW
ncbi:MAG: MtrB/PioB family decaheme-associated outer membrane protein [Pseudomonadales bacterium]